MTLDEEEHILSYRDKNGVKHETALGVEHLDVEHFSMKGESIDFPIMQHKTMLMALNLKTSMGFTTTQSLICILHHKRHTQRLMESNLSLLQM